MSAPINNNILNTSTVPTDQTNPAANQPGFQQQGALHNQQQPGQLNEHHGIAATGLNDHIKPAAPVTGAPLVDGANKPISGQHHNDHHLGRDAAAVGAAGAGLAHHEHNKHHDNTLTGHNNPVTGSNTHHDNTLTGHNNHHNDHHLGRDAAAVGATGAGLAHHEHNKHHDNTLTGQHHENPLTGQNNNISGESHTLAGRTHVPGQENVEHKLNDPHHHTGSAFEGTRATLGATSEPAGVDRHHHLGNDHKDHHTGRDAALGAGAGAGLAHEANKHHDKHTTGTANPLHHDNKEHHTGRDAVATGGVAGLASHEKAKHDLKHDEQRHAGVPQHEGLLPNKHNDKHTPAGAVEGETKPSATDKIKGNLEKVVGKVTGNEAKVIKGENLAHGRAE